YTGFVRSTARSATLSAGAPNPPPNTHTRYLVPSAAPFVSFFPPDPSSESDQTSFPPTTRSRAPSLDHCTLLTGGSTSLGWSSSRSTKSAFSEAVRLVRLPLATSIAQ